MLEAGFGVPCSQMALSDRVCASQSDLVMRGPVHRLCTCPRCTAFHTAEVVAVDFNPDLPLHEAKAVRPGTWHNMADFGFPLDFHGRSTGLQVFSHGGVGWHGLHRRQQKHHLTISDI